MIDVVKQKDDVGSFTIYKTGIQIGWYSADLGVCLHGEGNCDFLQISIDELEEITEKLSDAIHNDEQAKT